MNPLLVEEWKIAFEDVDNVFVSQGDITKYDILVDAIVSPANSFGYMTGGIDAVYVDWLGEQMHINARTAIERDHYGELPVGQAIVVETASMIIPSLVVAPTMREPMRVPPINAYLSFRAALIAIIENNKWFHSREISSVLCPGMGTLTGKIPMDMAAKLMRAAYDAINGRTALIALPG